MSKWLTNQWQLAFIPCWANGNLSLLIIVRMGFRWRNSFRLTRFWVDIENHFVLTRVTFQTIQRCQRKSGCEFIFGGMELWIRRVDEFPSRIKPYWCTLVMCISKMIQLFVYTNFIGDNIALYTLSRCQIILNGIPYCHTVSYDERWCVQSILVWILARTKRV